MNEETVRYMERRERSHTSWLYVGLYLVAIVLANLDIVWLQSLFGATDTVRLWATVGNAFLFIGLDLTARDNLHEAWKRKGLLWKMALLIGVGSLLSWLLNRNAGQIALASFVAFACAGIVDSIVYHLLGKKSRILRVNGSNVLSAAVDSVVFPTIAFGGFTWTITLGQFLAKVVGGFVWFWILNWKKARRGG